LRSFENKLLSNSLKQKIHILLFVGI